MNLSESISLIGSADGPTAIFLAGIVNTQVLIVTIVIGIILCIFGLKLMRVLSMAVGFLIGAGIGAVIVALAQLSGAASLAVILGCGIVMALLALFLRRVGAFISVLCYVFGALMTVFPADSMLFVIIAGVLSLILAVVAAIYVEPLVVAVSSIAGGLMAGPAIITLIGMEEKIWIGYIVAAVLAGLGVLIQLLMQSGKIKKKDKQYSQKIKEEDSRESEVEKARMILADGDNAEDGEANIEENIEENIEDAELDDGIEIIEIVNKE